ncbi:MC110L [Molluscum contagiosum virus subtype 1]|uniref:Early transcription factor 82 kDa subunit n=3 Tax=Molluscum contagiosum virus TaxID=10279 RepID=ETF2_MCV1|nr:MC110L [Molluscum contagiosum virus subtype 1]Q98277.1 RecName: Full=Early transcription factor 82 kDa subunit; AltName: Full=ETF large subunit [Molluscum contagiosum virus subtype 1]AZT86207.1 MC110L [Molluscum contagiosum virus]AAC55238.1 MC110L [Molluscum contagiosum virus subtype 1]AQY16859.1 MC110 [Molluscum contagiosum virus subtype 1]AQY17038.1 MC110 [Molluscum contagiosum virus subtype 1]AQY17217.1 MC110 [Molluscum contagiosum virus subtype 1]
MYTVNPQLVVLVDRQQQLREVRYLSLYGTLDEASPLYYFAKQHLRAETLAVERRHILLTLKISQLKGYLCHLLGLREDIIIYSHKNNLEYSYVDNTIFNPFTMTQKKTLIKADSFLYNVYVDACDFLVVWVARAQDTPVPEFGSFEEVDANILKFEARLVEMFPELDLEFSIQSKFNNVFRTNLRSTGLRNIVKRNQDNRILFIKTDEFFITMSGNHFVLNNEALNLSIWDAQGRLAISSDGDTITVNDVRLFTELVTDSNLQMERIKGDITYRIFLLSPITSKIKLDIETSFIFVETATNNILLSADKKISIILAKNHISIKVKNHIPNIEKYFTFLVIFINRMFNAVQQAVDFTKIETIYWSRICQNTRDKNRKPVIVSSLDANMERVSDNFFRSPTREVFVNSNNIMFSCVDPLGKYNSVGFLAIFYKLQKMCIPCCFLRSQAHTDTFISCVHHRELDRQLVSPYVLNFGKIVTEAKISFLPILFDQFFNEGLRIEFEADHKRLKATDGYHVVKCCTRSEITRLRTQRDIIQFVNAEQNTLIAGDMVYFPMHGARSAGAEHQRVYILIQEIVHEVVMVQKAHDSDRIRFRELERNRLWEFFPYRVPSARIKEEHGLVLTTDGFYVDGKLFSEPLSTRYVAFTENVGTAGVAAKYFAPVFKYVVTEARELFIKTWLLNVMMQLGLTGESSAAQTREALERYYRLS